MLFPVPMIELFDCGTWIPGRCIRVFNGHTDLVLTVAWSPDRRMALSGCNRPAVGSGDRPLCLVVRGHAPESTPAVPRPSQRAYLALLPLPDVGHRYARSQTDGCRGGAAGKLTTAERIACLHALGRVEELVDAHVFRLERCSSDESRTGLWPETWCKSARGVGERDAGCVWAVSWPALGHRSGANNSGHV
jgi:WD40 domain-containing protein